MKIASSTTLPKSTASLQSPEGVLKTRHDTVRDAPTTVLKTRH